MITNERQYRIAKAQLKKFDEALVAQGERSPTPEVDSRIHAAMGAALGSEADELRRQLREYERLRDGQVKNRTLRSLRDLPRVLVEARIASRATQKALAGRLGVAEQQVQRWEATEYAGVSVERIQEIADALGAEITEKVSFALAAPRVSRASKQSKRRTAAGAKTRSGTGAAPSKARSSRAKRSSAKRTKSGHRTRTTGSARKRAS